MKKTALFVALLACSLPSMAQHPFNCFNGMDEFLPFLAIVMTFGMPVVIMFFILWFNYKNKKARYQIISEALASGKELPAEFYTEKNPSNAYQEVLTKGIKNVFLGIGLGVFLWVMTEKGGIASIGFLIFCIGMGQIVIAYATRSKSTDKHLEQK